MSLLRKLLGRLGYVKLSEYGLTIAPDGRVVSAYPMPVYRQAHESHPASSDSYATQTNAQPFSAAPAPAPTPYPPYPPRVASAPAPTDSRSDIRSTRQFWIGKEIATQAPKEGTQILRMDDLLECYAEDTHAEPPRRHEVTRVDYYLPEFAKTGSRG
jgi:hypothetical protein